MNRLFDIGPRRGLVGQTSAEAVGFGVDQRVLPITLWDGDKTNTYEINGTLTLDGQPVAGAVVRANRYVLPEPTAADGGFVIRRDRTVLDRTVVQVVGVEAAQVGGTALTQAQQDQLLAADLAVATVFEMHLDDGLTIQRGDSGVTISGRLTFADDTTPVPPVTIWGYILGGVVRNLDGDPVEDVVVSISDDEGETWALSNRTEEDGRYDLRFFPESDTPFEVRVAQGPSLFTSSDRISFDVETSAELDLVVPAEGTTLLGASGEETLLPSTVPGAEYLGIICSLAINDVPVEANVTWPDDDGQFVITIPSVTAPGTASFYQAKRRFFAAGTIAPGAPVPLAVLPARLEPEMPQGLQPITIQ